MASGSLRADLVLEGGGVKGIGLVGAYSELVARGYEAHRVAGTSAGAIVGALIAAGMAPDRMEKVMRELDYEAFQDKGFLDHLGRVGKGLSVLFEKGIYEGDALRDWLDGLLTEMGTPTFGDLRLEDPGGSLPAERSYKLVVVVSDVSLGRLVCFPWDYPRYGLDPDKQRVADAVRASASIPFFYEPVVLAGRDDNGEALQSYLVDGGILSNFPITIFDRTDNAPPRWPTFGCKLSARPDQPLPPKFKITGTLDFVKAMAGTLMSFHDQLHIDDPAVIARTIFIDTFGVRATDFDLDEATQDDLFASGLTATSAFFHSGWDFDDYIRTHRTPAPDPAIP